MRGFRRLPRLIGGHAGAFDFHAGREAERPLDPIGGDPRQRNTAPIATLVLGRTFTVARSRILKLVPRDVSDLEQAELLTLIQVRRTGQREFHQNRSPRATRADFTILVITGAVTQQPVMRKLMVPQARHLRQGVTTGVTRHIMIAHHPRGRRSGATRRFQALLNRLVHIVAHPVLLREFEVEHLAELIIRRVQILPRRIDPRLCHGECRRIILVENLAPLPVDLVHIIAIIQRIAAISRQTRRSDAPIIEIRTVEILAQTVSDVDTEAISAVVKPKTQGLDEVGLHIRVLPVPVGLLHGKQVQIPLAVRHARPRGTAEMGHPVGGRQFTVFAATVTENVAIALGRSGAGGKRGFEPRMQVGGMIGNDVNNDFDTRRVRSLSEFVEIVHRAEFRVDIAVIVHVISAVGELARVEGAEPNRVNTQLLQVVDATGYACDIAETGTGGVFERARIHLIDHRLMPPCRRGTIRSRGFLGALWGLVLCHARSFPVFPMFPVVLRRLRVSPRLRHRRDHGWES